MYLCVCLCISLFVCEWYVFVCIYHLLIRLCISFSVWISLCLSVYLRVLVWKLYVFLTICASVWMQYLCVLVWMLSVFLTISVSVRVSPCLSVKAIFIFDYLCICRDSEYLCESYMYFWISVCLSVYLRVFVWMLSVFLNSVRLSEYLCVFVSHWLSVYAIWISVRLSAYLCVCSWNSQLSLSQSQDDSFKLTLWGHWG